MRHRVEICGGIASGKTTLALLLAKHGFVAALENFKANPFWEAFYSDIQKYSFETEISFFLQHYHQIKTNSCEAGLLVCDFSLHLDRSYAEVTLTQKQRRAFLAVYDEASTHIPPPALLVHLTCSPDIELSRIRARARPVEQSITVQYLQEINQAVVGEVSVVSSHVPVLEIDSGTVDFAHNANVQTELARTILSQVQE